jgi:hypothetical protein
MLTFYSKDAGIVAPQKRVPAHWMNGRPFIGLFLMMAVILGTDTVTGGAKRAPQVYNPPVDPANFQTTVDNPWFPLVPGTVFSYREQVGGSTNENEVIVTKDVKAILGVTCIVVHDKVMEKGVLKEETFDWYAQDRQGNVWYFGEATREFESGGKVSTGGSWEAGVDGALPGIIMTGKPAPGKPYRQEYYAGEAEDMGQIVAVNESVTVPYGSFTGCVRTREWSMLEPGSEKKWYAKGIGTVRTESSSNKEISVLVSIAGP